MFVKKGDTVVILAGEDIGKKGKVLSTVPKHNKVVVEGVNIVSRHQKARSAQQQSGIVKKEAPIDASNVQVICPVCEQPTRIGIRVADGKKVRVCKKCGRPVDPTSKDEGKTDKKAEKPAAKKPAAKKTTTKKTAEKSTGDAAAKLEKKTKKPKSEVTD